MPGKHDTGRRRGQTLWGLLCFGLAAFLFAIALGWLSPAATDPGVSPAVIAVCGLVCLVAGLMLILGTRSWINDALAAVLCLSLAATGAWAAMFGDAARISGGLPFLSTQQNVALARFMFALGSLVCASLAVYAVVLAVRRSRKN